MERLQVEGAYWRDTHGRRVLLRGVNLSGSSKLPFGLTAKDRQHMPGRALSFVGRPFPEAEADAHFARLAHWGFNCLRFLTTWEAIEPEAPGRYDEAYLDYFRRMVQKAGDHGFQVFVDPHQDAWCRLTGGDGAPLWTLALAGFDPTRLDRSEAAITMAERLPDYAGMIWPNNWGRLASCTMFTLFFAGSRFAPRCLVGDEPIESYLQRHFIGAMRQVAVRLADLPHVLGYDSLNEPSRGFIGMERLSAPLPVYNHGPQLTAFDALCIPAGISRVCPLLARDGLSQRQAGTVTLNPGRASAWRDVAADIWRQHGVWDVGPDGQPRLLRDDYFAGVQFYADCIRPFVSRYGQALRAVHPGVALFIEGEPGATEPVSAAPADFPVVNASHWYDLLTLITKHYTADAAMVWGSTETVRGAAAVRRSFADQIAEHARQAAEHLGGAPTLIGEFGVPFDLDDGASFRTGDFAAQTAALSAYYDALDANLAHATLWNYTPDNTNADGDHWNREDLSIYSADQRDAGAGPDSGGRGVAGFCRPTVRACQGVPLLQTFDRATGAFALEIDLSSAAPAPTLVYAPLLHYPGGPAATVSTGRVSYDPARQLLSWEAPPGTAARARLELRPRAVRP